MKKARGIIIGILVIAIGVVLGLNALEITNINLFFDGWWTLFIIIPCGISLFTGKEKLGSIVGIIAGVLLLLSAQDLFDLKMVWKILVPVLIISIGIKLILKSLNTTKKAPPLPAASKASAAVFSGQDLDYSGEVYAGATYVAVFGGVECDLRNADICNNAVINATCIFGGIDILLPPNVDVRVVSSSFFGGVSQEKRGAVPINATTLHINGTCIFGGIDIK